MTLISLECEELSLEIPSSDPFTQVKRGMMLLPIIGHGHNHRDNYISNLLSQMLLLKEYTGLMCRAVGFVVEFVLSYVV